MQSLSASRLENWVHDWEAWAHGAQLPPPGDWRAWVFMGGRGAGKTRAGAEWVSAGVREGRFSRVALIAPTFQDVREVMIDGPSGLRSLPYDRPHYEPSRKRLTWANGALAFCFSAEDPASLRGPQFDAAWCDELCFWSYPDETLEILAHGLRLGDRPLMLATTTPRPIRALKKLLARPDTVVTQAGTFANAHNLAPDFTRALREHWTGSARERQELLGELIEDVEGAMWRRADLEAVRVQTHPPLTRIVVAVDPPAAQGARAAQCGIIAAGIYGEPRRAVVLADASVQGVAPQDWAARAAALARSLNAGAIVAESNNGGEMVRAVLRAAAPDIPVRLVRASEGKRARAEPIAALYARGLVSHAAAFAALEDEMCSFGAEGAGASPDRLDALVWALTDLMMVPVREPHVRTL